MQFTPGQVKEAVGLTEETLRYWRRVLPGFAGRRGHRPCFSFGDMLALSIAKVLTRSFGIKVSTVVHIAPQLAEFCKSETWLSKETWFIVFEPEEGRLLRTDESIVRRLTRAAMVIPCRPLADALKSRLIRDPESSAQMPLPFTPAVIEPAPHSGSAHG